MYTKSIDASGFLEHEINAPLRLLLNHKVTENQTTKIPASHLMVSQRCENELKLTVTMRINYLSKKIWGEELSQKAALSDNLHTGTCKR